MDDSAGFEQLTQFMLRQLNLSLGIPKDLVDGNSSNYSSAMIAGQHYLRQLDHDRPEPVLVLNCNLLTERRQFRFPRSKKRRIRAKWSKDYRNFREEPSLSAIRAGSTFFVHPRIRARFIRKLNKALAELKPVSLFPCY